MSSVRAALSLLPPRLRRFWLALVPLFTLAALVELLAAAAVFWMIREVSGAGQGSLRTDVLLRAIFGNATPSLLQCVSLVASVFLVKNILLAAASWGESRLIADSIEASFHRLLSGYLAAPYAFHLRRRPADFIHDATAGVDATYRLVVSSVVGLWSEAAVAAALAAVLLAFVPGVTAAVLVVLGLALFGIVAVTRRRVARWGREVNDAGREVLHRLGEIFSAIKEIKSYRKESAFRESAMSPQRRFARATRGHLTILAMPRLVTETVFIAVAFLIFVSLERGPATARHDLLPLLGLFAYTGFRLVPAANRIIYDYDHIRHGRETVARLSRLFREIEAFEIRPPTAARAPFQDRIELKSVSFTYGGAREVALQDVTLTIRSGEFIGLTGPTGSGKTTLLDLIAGVIEPSSGLVTIDGHYELPEIAYVQQTPAILDDTLSRNVAFGIPDGAIDDDRLRVALESSQIEGLPHELGGRSDTNLGDRGSRLSGGERQRIAIARALYTDPSILLLDEPTASVDSETRRRISEVIRSLRGKTTVVIAAHDPEALLGCDRIFMVRDGRVLPT